MRYYSPSTGGFYDSAIHGARTVLVPDPAWTPIEGEDAPSIEIPNALCLIPEDAIEITAEQHADLVDGAGTGQLIEIQDGAPALVDKPAPPLAQTKAALCAQVDAAADAVYVAIGGPSPGRLAEYQQAKSDALAFQASGYAGAAPVTVSCWSQAQGWTDQAACDDILATAAQWEGALQAIRSTRLGGKASINAASDAAGAQAAAAAAIANIRAVVGG